jgi:peptide-methionine (R)-S-oxide reductase
MTQIDRRHLLLGSAAVAGLAACGPQVTLAAAPVPESSDPSFAGDPFRKITEREWSRRLGDDLSYTVLRQEDTEDRFSSSLLEEHRVGTFYCKGCDLPLFESQWKYESHTGWPSFHDVMKPNVGTKVDRTNLTETRTEYHCARCLGHQGHVFNDGPRPTGLRYCNNGAAITFKPKAA